MERLVSVGSLLDEEKEITMSSGEALSLVLGCFLSSQGVDLVKYGNPELDEKIMASARETLRKIGVKRLSTDLRVGLFNMPKTVELAAE